MNSGLLYSPASYCRPSLTVLSTSWSAGGLSFAPQVRPRLPVSAEWATLTHAFPSQRIRVVSRGLHCGGTPRTMSFPFLRWKLKEAEKVTEGNQTDLKYIY